MAKEDNKETKSSTTKSFEGKGIVLTPFKVKDKKYKVGDEYSTKDEFTFNYLKSNHKIK